MIGVALAAGLAASLHCPFMCGPLACAGGKGALPSYLGGRILSYGAIGALLGAVGEHALCVLPLATVQTVTVVLVAVFALTKGLRVLWPRAQLVQVRRPSRVWRFLPRRGAALGLATGILPCGMLLPAWMLAASSGGAADGALAMAVFCAATTPGLVAPLLAARLVRRLPPRAIGLAYLALAAWLLVRPLLMAGHVHGAMS